MGDSAVSLAFIAAAAVLAPILADLVRKPRIPGVLFELLLGILIGPQVLAWAEPTRFVTGLSELGIAMLFFVAGFEIDFRRLRGQPAKRAVEGWVVSLVLGLTVGFILVAVGFALSGLLIGLVLTTTAIGTLLPILRDRGILPTHFGVLTLAAGAVGEFGPILAITLLLTGDNPAEEAGLLVAFVAVALGAAYLASRPQPPGMVKHLQRSLGTSAQLPVRIAVLLLVLMVLLASELGLDTLLGAFTAGIVLRLALSRQQREELEPRLSAIGFGLLIPVFFIVSGMRFDVDGLFGSSEVLMRVPIFLALFLVVRGLPALVVYRHALPVRLRAALAFLQSTALPLVVVITEIGIATDNMKPENATALVGAAMLSVLLYPLIGFAFAAKAAGDPALAVTAEDEAAVAEVADEIDYFDEP
ncbi:MAG: cation:proton antiporter [Actinobacteria bacterium]|nr:cation:proton antiporter [Actinomycetota bacterium]